MEERNYLFDNIKAFLIFSTAFAHFLKQMPGFDGDTGAGFIYIAVFSYIMQGFFLISGFFSKNLDKCRQTAVKNFLVPYIIFIYLTNWVFIAIRGTGRGDIITPSFALWFLFAMFVYKFALKTLVKIPYILPICAVLYFVSGVFPELDDTWTSSRICCFLLFFMAGYKMEWKHFNAIRRIPKAYIYILLGFLIVFSVCVGYFELFNEGLLYLKKPYENYGLECIEGMIWRLVIAFIFSGWMVVFVNLMPEKKTFLSDIGRKTITVYLLHIWVRYLFMYTNLIGSGGIDSYVIALATAVACTWLFSRDPVFKAYNWALDKIYWPIDFIWKKIRKIA